MIDIVLYGLSGLTAVGLSIWFFLVWQKQENFKDTHPIRYLIMVLPTAFFLLISFSGWAQVLFLRMDVLGLFIFILLGLIFFIIQLIPFLLKIKKYETFFIISTISYFILGAVIVGFVYAVKVFPLLGVRISTFFQVWKDVDFFKVLWEGIGTEKENITNLVIKIFIALFTYVPLTIFRIWFMNKKLNQMRKEIQDLRELINNK